ncbi:sigma-70 family RNA polymerase sigma factor [Nocardioides anomalus]|uniref:sigma-70 family RNA polymerase sigma factor n=1 Tax=Nocardioides anomalus TaxID=2712223 RepID=UPI001E2DC7D0|nr:sigma-70 family RNA polymerase sigma factor [Nocardioides anomalus]
MTPHLAPQDVDTYLESPRSANRPVHPATTPATDADALATTHLPLVQHLVRETMSRVPAHVDRDDLSSAGLVALVQAARAWDPERGIPFPRYAATRIRGALLDELRSVDWASRSVRRRGREIDTARSALAVRLRRVPEDTEVAAELGVALAEIQRSDDDLARASVLSLDAGEDGTAASEALASPEPTPDAMVEHRERLQYLEAAVVELPERLRHVVQGYFIDERPMAELAEELGVTESRISQLRAEALVLLRDALNTALDPELVAPAERPEGVAARRRTAYFRAVADRHAAAYSFVRQVPALPTTA